MRYTIGDFKGNRAEVNEEVFARLAILAAMNWGTAGAEAPVDRVLEFIKKEAPEPRNEPEGP